MRRLIALVAGILFTVAGPTIGVYSATITHSVS